MPEITRFHLILILGSDTVGNDCRFLAYDLICQVRFFQNLLINRLYRDFFGPCSHRIRHIYDGQPDKKCTEQGNQLQSGIF